MSAFRPAVRQQLRLRMALAGPSGSGKTITALRLAQGLGKRIAVIDTENRSASRYIGEDFGEGPIQFDVVELDSFEPRRLVSLLREAAEAGYDVVVVDSLSHFWMGEGGMLDTVDAAAKRNSGNSFAGWKAAKPIERELLDALIRCQTHLICTLRVKTEYVIEDNDRGKKTPRKVGMKAEQRDGLEYEFDVVGDVDLEHNLVCSKTRCSALDGKTFVRPGGDVAKILRRWLDSGEAADDRRKDAEPRRQQEPERQAERQAEPAPINVEAFLEAMAKVDSGWTRQAVQAAAGCPLEKLPRPGGAAMLADAKAGKIRPPKPNNSQPNNTQPADNGGEDDII